MTEQDLVIGLDSSTTACKAVVWDLQGKAVAVGRAPLPMIMPRPGWHEQPAVAWWEAALQALRNAAAQVEPGRLAAISISAQRETFVITDAAGEPLGNALLWMDERASDLLPEIETRYGKERFHQETGKPLSTNLSVGKLLWLRQHQPELFAQPIRILDVHAFLTHQMTGKWVTSWGCADPMGLFDMRQNCWNADLIEAVGLSVNQFPEAQPVGSFIGNLLPEVCQAASFPAGIPLYAGIGDGQAAGLGVSLNQPGEAYLNLGTAVVSGTFSDRYLVDPAFRTMYGGLPDSYVLETVLLGGAYTINWFMQKFSGLSENAHLSEPAALQLMEKEAAQIPPGAQGLTLVPYWNGAMNPYWDASASGIIVGWRGIHGRAHLYRAILEGIAMEQRLHMDGIETTLGTSISRFIAVGGGAHSALWCQILADVTGKPLYQADAPELSALGAGILAAVGSN